MFHGLCFGVVTLIFDGLTVTCMWSGGISKRNPVRPAGKWVQGLTCQTAKTPPAILQIVSHWLSRFMKSIY